MFYNDADLRRVIAAAVDAVFSKNPVDVSELTDLLFVQLKPLVKNEERAYTVAQLREMLSGLI